MVFLSNLTGKRGGRALYYVFSVVLYQVKHKTDSQELKDTGG